MNQQGSQTSTRPNPTARTRKGQPSAGKHGTEDRAITTTPTQLKERIDQLADDIGRLRRHAQQLGYLAERLADNAEALHLTVTPSAGELAKWTAPGDAAAVDEAIAVVDADLARLLTRLGRTAA